MFFCEDFSFHQQKVMALCPSIVSLYPWHHRGLRGTCSGQAQIFDVQPIFGGSELSAANQICKAKRNCIGIRIFVCRYMTVSWQSKLQRIC